MEMLLVNFTEPLINKLLRIQPYLCFLQYKLNYSCYEFAILKVSE